MASWTDGYVTDIQYTSGFYRELAPSLLIYVALITGQRAPSLEEPFTYCELGCGQGFGTNIIAAANPQGRFWGFDFNPAQIANARRLAARAGLKNVTFGEDSFEQLARRPDGDLPKFDFIVLHGIYSWITEANRNAIVRFIAQNLRAGGLVYVSYNSLPGWSAAGPLQRLILEHAKANPERSDRQFDAARTFMHQLREGGARYFAVNPAVVSRLEGMDRQSRNYLAHEYLNGSWHPLYHADVVRELEPAKLTFVASANILENIDGISVPKDVRPILNTLSDPVMVQTVKDYALNQQFRRDVFVKGASVIPSVEHLATLRETRFLATRSFPDKTLTFQTPLGEATASDEVYRPLYEPLTQEHGISIGEALTLPSLSGQPLQTIAQSLAVLSGTGHAHPALSIVSPEADACAARFNRSVIESVLDGSDLSFLASARIGSGIPVSAIDMFAIDALWKDADLVAGDLATEIWKRMLRSGRRVNQDGEALTEEADNLKALVGMAETILKEKFPIWRSLGLLAQSGSRHA